MRMTNWLLHVCLAALLAFFYASIHLCEFISYYYDGILFSIANYLHIIIEGDKAYFAVWEVLLHFQYLLLYGCQDAVLPADVLRLLHLV